MECNNGILPNKSKYLHGLQCHKRLWYEQNRPGRATAPSRAQIRIFNQSREAQSRARCEFPDGRLIDTTDPLEAAEQTQEAISSDVSCIFDASFILRNDNWSWWVRCDILERDLNSWKIIGVEAPTDVKEEHLSDLAFQKYVLTEQGITISGTKVMYINRECVYPDLSNLFTIEDVTDQVDQLMDDVPNNIETFEAILDEDVEPEVPIGRHCGQAPSLPI